MKIAKMTTLLVAGLFSCLSMTVLYAVCVTPKQLTDAATALKDNTYYTAATPPGDANADFVKSIFGGRTATTPAFTGLVPTAPGLGTATLVAQWSGLNSDTMNWQKKTPPTVTLVPVVDMTELKNMNDHFNVIQKWATYGELVIAITDSATGANDDRIAIVVPSATPIAPGTANWAKINVPQIAFVGTLPNGTAGGGTYTRTATGLMSDIFKDPRKVTVFRYKN